VLTTAHIEHTIAKLDVRAHVWAANGMCARQHTGQDDNATEKEEPRQKRAHTLFAPCDAASPAFNTTEQLHD
jgi:hypothetical protein